MLEIETWLLTNLPLVTSYKVRIGNYLNESETLFIEATSVLHNPFSYDRKNHMDNFYYTLFFVGDEYEKNAIELEKVEAFIIKTKLIPEIGVHAITPMMRQLNPKIGDQYLFSIDLEIKKERTYE